MEILNTYQLLCPASGDGKHSWDLMDFFYLYHERVDVHRCEYCDVIEYNAE